MGGFVPAPPGPSLRLNPPVTPVFGPFRCTDDRGVPSAVSHVKGDWIGYRRVVINISVIITIMVARSTDKPFLRSFLKDWLHKDPRSDSWWWWVQQWWWWWWLFIWERFSSKRCLHRSNPIRPICSFWPFKLVFTKAFKPVSSNLWQSVALLDHK